MSAPAPRPGILDISPYVGGEAHAPGVDRLIRLASNEGALGPSPRAMEAYRNAAAEVHRYPDGHSTALRDSLARLYGLDASRIVCGTGSDELLGLLTRAYAGPGDEVLYSAHGFLMYPISAKSVGATPVAAPEKGSEGRCRCPAGACDGADEDRLHRQPEQSDGQLPDDGRDAAPACRICRSMSCW